MDEQYNGQQDIKTLPPVKLANGPAWKPTADLAARFMQHVYEVAPDVAARCMYWAMTGDELPAGRRRQ